MNARIIKISIIVVNWNSGKQLSDCMKTISNAALHARFEIEVIVVDNASSDDSLVGVADSSKYVKVIRNSTNRGFAAACNQGAFVACGEYFLYLNPDTRLNDNALVSPVEFMSRPGNNKIAICGINLKDDSGRPSTSAAHFPSVRNIATDILGLSRLAPSLFSSHMLTATEMPSSRIVDQVIGAYFMIRRDVFNACGGFDEQFFVYYEEVDLSKRVYEIGFQSYYLANVSSFHKGGGCSEQVKAYRLFYSLQSRLKYIKKHFSFSRRIAVILLMWIEFPLRLAKALIGGSVSDARNTVHAYALLINSFWA